MMYHVSYKTMCYSNEWLNQKSAYYADALVLLDNVGPKSFKNVSENCLKSVRKQLVT